MRRNWCIEEGYFVCVTIKNLPVTFLIDTGSNVTILSKDLMARLPSDTSLSVQPTNIKMLTVTGEVTPFLGKTEMEFGIGTQTLKHKALIADIENDGILGMDFLTSHQCDLMLTRQIMKVNGEEILCFANSRNAQPRCCRVAVLEPVEIPAETEVVIPGYTWGVIDKRGTGLIEADMKFMHTRGLLVAKALVSPTTGTVPVRIANPYDQSFKLYKNTIVATYEPIEPELILSVNNVQSEQNLPATCSNTDIPEHLKELHSKSSQHLTQEQQARLKQILTKYQNQFSKNAHDLGRTTLIEHHINVQPGTKPIKQQPYRLPLAKRQDAEKEIKAMAERDLIEPSTSPWSSPAIIVPKKNGGIRFCIDYRRLNKVTIPDSMPLPRCDDSLDALGGSKWFSTLDLRSGFHQLALAKESRPYTAFCIPGSGLWQFKVVPFGAMNSPAEFERLMEKVFAGLTYVTLLLYLDDIIVYGKTFEIHLQNLEEVFKRLAEANLKLNPEKCALFQPQVSFLGHLVSEAGIAVDPEKIKAVQDWPVPRNVTEVRSFIGLCSYMRRFISGFSSICKPLHLLTQKDHKYEWNEECQEAFDTLKTALTTAPVLGFPQESQGEFILDADCSNNALGSVLSQIQDGEERVISYYSKCLTKPERRYCTTRKELLAVVSSIKHFHHYLYGRHFKVRSDHGSLRWLMNFRNCEGQLARFLETLATYDFTIEFRAGIRHNNADSLSRRPCVDRGCAHCERFEAKYNDSIPGLATRNIGVMLMESTNMGECLERDSRVRVPVQSWEGQDPSENDIGMSPCSEEAPLLEHGSVKELECLQTGGIRDGTAPKLVSPGEDSENLFLEAVVSQPPLTDENNVEGLGCDPTRVNETTRGKQLQLRNSVDTQFSCYIGVPETTLGGTLGTRLKGDDLLLHCTEDTDSDSSFSCDDEEESEENESGSAYARNVDIIDVDCLARENVKDEQDKQLEIQLIKQWKSDKRKPEWAEISKYGPELKAYWSMWDSLSMTDGVLYRKKVSDESLDSKPQIVLPIELRKKCFALLHDTVTAGHLGSQKTVAKVKQRFYWYNCRKDVEYWCRTCDICASRKQPYRRAKAPMKQYNVGYPLERVAIDIMGPLPRSNNARYLLLVSCYFTKWLDAIPINSIDAKTVATKLIERFISIFGCPISLHSDQGSNFESLVFQEVCNLLGIKKTRTTPGRPQSDGMIERACRTVQAMLSAYVAQNQQDWDTYIPLLMMAYRSSVHDTTKCTPSSMMLGREIRLPIDLALGIPETRQSKSETDYAYELEKQLVKIHDIARKHVQICSDGMKMYYDRNINFTEFSIGDAVWFHNPVRKKGISLKLQRPWKGPYLIVEKYNDILYKIQKSPRDKAKVVHFDRLKPYNGENKPTWLNC